MPPDALLMLASSGLTLVASLMFFISDERPPADAVDAPLMDFCLPPRPGVRPSARPPPLPVHPACQVALRTNSLDLVLSMSPRGEEWVVTLECAPLADTPALQVVGEDGHGQVNDLRWHGRAGLPRTVRRQYKLKPGRA